MWFCVISVPPPRLAPAAPPARPLRWRRSRGRELGRWVRGGLDSDSAGAEEGWLLLGIPASTSQGGAPCGAWC